MQDIIFKHKTKGENDIPTTKEILKQHIQLKVPSRGIDEKRSKFYKLNIFKYNTTIAQEKWRK